ncbi:MAG: hypothetical protein J6B50_00785 [Lachnospiraceae bacterium]|nr:hypothetical protein [Lachnospiraceae bacterium]MBP3507659.1 hypothetical protein [Lachnospiraceae bacterium]
MKKRNRKGVVFLIGILMILLCSGCMSWEEMKQEGAELLEQGEEMNQNLMDSADTVHQQLLDDAEQVNQEVLNITED